MKANYLITAISLLLANVNGQGVIDVLNLNGFTNFATGLQNYPDLLSEISCRNRIIVWAPINEVPDFSSHVNDTTPLLFRRQSLDVLKYGQHASEPTSSSPQPTTTSNQKRHIGTLPDSNAEVLRTFLRDPRFVNLGPHERGRIVQNYAAPSHGSRGEANLEIKAGLGIAEKVSGPFKYDHGIIYGVNKFFDLPLPLIDSLSVFGFNTFIDAITSSGLEQKLSDSPAITIFAFPNSRNTSSVNLNEYTVTGYLGFSPVFEDQGKLLSDAGTTLEFSFSHGSYFVNGIRIIRTDVILKNGVLHLLEKPFSEVDNDNYTPCCNIQTTWSDGYTTTHDDYATTQNGYATTTPSDDYGTATSTFTSGVVATLSSHGNATIAPTPVVTFTGSAARYGSASVALLSAIIALVGLMHV